MTQPSKSAVIFGIHGTLLDTGEINRQTFDEVFQTFGYPGVPKLEQSVRGMPLRDQLVLWNQAAGSTISYEDFVVKVDEIKTRLYEKLQLDPALQRFLDDLRAAGVRIGVATSTSRTDAERLLTQVKLMESIDALVTIDETGSGKPRGEVFLKVIEKLALEPNQCLAIEDSASGIAAAHEAGMKAIGFTGYIAKNMMHDLAEADYVADSYDELTSEKVRELLSA